MQNDSNLTQDNGQAGKNGAVMSEAAGHAASVTAEDSSVYGKSAAEASLPETSSAGGKGSSAAVSGAENPDAGKSEEETSASQRFLDKAVKVLEKVAAQRHVLALRDGMLGAVPIILVGSTFLLLGAQGDVLNQFFAGQVSWLPDLVHTAFGSWYLENSADFYVPYRLTMGLMALYIAFTVASALAVQYGMAPVPQGLGAVAALLVTEAPFKTALGNGNSEWVIRIKPMGPEGIFLGIAAALFMVEVSRLFMRADKAGSAEDEAIRSSIPPAVTDAFRSFLPMLLCVTVIWGIRHVFDFNINAAILSLMSPLAAMGDTLAAVEVCNFFLHLFAVAGIHGISVINAVMLPLWQQFVAANAEAHSAGLPLPHVTAYPFYQWFIWIGGSGATLAPTLMLFFFRSEHFRRVGRLAVIPAFFNVNEPFLFGLPVIASPILAIPCVIAPMLCGITSWYAVSLGFVRAPFIEVPWVMPGFIGALLSTQDWKSLVLFAVNFLISGAVWYPFLHYVSRRIDKAPENSELSEETDKSGKTLPEK